MAKYTVLDPSGFFFNRVKHKEGAEIELEPCAQLDAGLHFKQLKKVPASKASKSEEKEPTGDQQ